MSDFKLVKQFLKQGSIRIALGNYSAVINSLRGVGGYIYDQLTDLHPAGQIAYRGFPDKRSCFLRNVVYTHKIDFNGLICQL